MLTIWFWLVMSSWSDFGRRTLQESLKLRTWFSSLLPHIGSMERKWGIFCLSGKVYQRDTSKALHAQVKTHGDTSSDQLEERRCHFRWGSGCYCLSIVGGFTNVSCEHTTRYDSTISSKLWLCQPNYFGGQLRMFYGTSEELPSLDYGTDGQRECSYVASQMQIRWGVHQTKRVNQGGF